MINNNYNYRYGRPALGAPPINGLQLGPANGNGQPMKSIGYYYEDDDEYDMKTMYINDAFDGK